MISELDAVWDALDADTVDSPGQIRRRVQSRAGYDLHLTQNRPSRTKGFLANFGGESGSLWRSLQASKGLDIEVPQSGGNPTGIQLTERDPRFHAVFVALVADILSGLEVVGSLPETSRPIPLDFVAGRIQRWQACLKTSPEGLSDEKQAGLFGELTVMRHLLAAGLPAISASAAWTGPLDALQDFQYEGSSIEVKSSRQTQPTTVRISSERQLDTTGMKRLFLIHVALGPRLDGVGESLPSLVDSVRQLCGRESGASLLLDDRLIGYGYLDVHAPKYEPLCFSLRNLEAFEVLKGFPRIVESDLPAGVGDASYSLALSACESYRVAPDVVWAQMGGVAQ
jgi:hypothetical protein